jgi:hypothetical protein
VIVGYYALVVFLWKQGKQTFAVYGLGIWFAQMQNVQAFLKQCCQYLVFLYEKVGAAK